MWHEVSNRDVNIVLWFLLRFFSGGVMIYFDRIEVVNVLSSSSGMYRAYVFSTFICVLSVRYCEELYGRLR